MPLLTGGCGRQSPVAGLHWKRWASAATIAFVAFAYPILLDVSGRKILLVGGGKVAVRKARGLLEAGAGQVFAVAPVFRAPMPAAVIRIKELFQERHLEGMGLVFAATDDPQVNQSVVREANRRGIWVCRVDRDESGLDGDFVTPAHARRGPWTVAVGGADMPALAAKIRNDLLVHWPAEMEALATDLAVLRRQVLKTCPASQRAALLRVMCGDEAIERWRMGGLAGLRCWIETAKQTSTVASGPATPGHGGPIESAADSSATGDTMTEPEPL